MAAQAQGELFAGRYRRLRTIGVGGMARVHLAEDERLGRLVAVKRLHADSPDDAALRFEREAKLGASLNHPNLVSIYDIESDGESVLIVMEYVEGETLQDAIGRGPLPPRRALAVVEDVAAGLDHAHRHGVVHRDVKPANILLRDDGVAKLADLGIASAAEQTAITRSGVVMGTASYMAPEQLDGGAAGPSTDIYALAAVAFEALSGEKARAGRTPLEIAHEIVTGRPPDLARAWHGAPAAAGRALERGMARNPEDRPASAGALAAELARGLAAERTAPTARMPAAPGIPPRSPEHRTAAHRPPRPRSAGRRWAAALVTVVAAAIVAAILLAGRGGSDPAPTERTTAETADSRPAPRPRANRRAEPETDRAAPVPSPTPAPPPSGDAGQLNDRGYALMQAGRYDEAIPLLEQAVAQYPEGSQELTYAYALYNLGRSLRLAGRPQEAVPILERRLLIPNQTETVERELAAARSQAG
jgi:serine/threonine-protein kinase